MGSDYSNVQVVDNKWLLLSKGRRYNENKSEVGDAKIELPGVCGPAGTVLARFKNSNARYVHVSKS